jgi:hypothetical protein
MLSLPAKVEVGNIFGAIGKFGMHGENRNSNHQTIFIVPLAFL